MHSWVIFISLSAFVLGVIVNGSDGAYDPVLKQAAERLTRRCEDCGYYECECPPPRSSGKSYVRSRSSSDCVGDECYEYSGSSGGKSRSGSRARGSSGTKSYGGDDYVENSGRSASRGAARGGGYLEFGGELEFSGEVGYETGGGYVEGYSGEVVGKGGKGRGYCEECVSGGRKPRPGGPPPKRPKKGKSYDC